MRRLQSGAKAQKALAFCELLSFARRRIGSSPVALLLSFFCRRHLSLERATTCSMFHALFYAMSRGVSVLFGASIDGDVGCQPSSSASAACPPLNAEGGQRGLHLQDQTRVEYEASILVGSLVLCYPLMTSTPRARTRCCHYRIQGLSFALSLVRFSSLQREELRSASPGLLTARPETP